MGLLDGSELKSFQEHLKEKSKSPCSVCGARSFDVLDAVGMPAQVRGISSGLTPGPQTMVAIPVVCTNCYHISYFAAGPFTSLK
jgi:hypothetical protein